MGVSMKTPNIKGKFNIGAFARTNTITFSKRQTPLKCTKHENKFKINLHSIPPKIQKTDIYNVATKHDEFSINLSTVAIKDHFSVSTPRHHFDHFFNQNPFLT